MVDTFRQELVKRLNVDKSTIDAKDISEFKDIRCCDENIFNITDVINQFSIISISVNNVIDKLIKIEDMKIDDFTLLDFGLRILAMRNNLYFLEQELEEM